MSLKVLEGGEGVLGGEGGVRRGKGWGNYAGR